MKVFIYESNNGVNSLFQLPEFHIPFLSSNLLSFLGSGIVRSSAALDDTYQVFLPEHWRDGLENSHPYSFYSGDAKNQLDSHQKRDYELVFITSLFSLMVGDLFDADISYLKQNPEKLFMNRGVVGGYLKRGQELPRPEVFDGFKNFIQLDETNFLRLNQDLVGNLSIDSVESGARKYGHPIILSDSVNQSSTVCGPCYISEGAVVENSYIAPGTVIVGNCHIINSRVYGSFISESTLENSVLHDAVVTESNISSVELLKHTRLPSGSVINGERKI